MISKALLRDVIASTLSAIKVFDRSLARNNQWLILTFHRVLPLNIRESYPLANLAVTPVELAWIIDCLTPYFDVMTVSDAAQAFQSKNGEYKTDKPILSLSFDDGQWDNIEYALPVLEEKGVAATFYLPTDYIGTGNLLWHDRAAFAWRILLDNPQLESIVLKKAGLNETAGIDFSGASSFVNSLKKLRPEQRLAIVGELNNKSNQQYEWARMMTWTEARQLLEKGHEVGSHGLSHNLLPQQKSTDQEKELRQSALAIEEHLNCLAKSFCYPNGDYNQQTLQLLEASAYNTAVTTRWGINGSAASPYELLRCDMNPFLLVDRHGRLSKNRLLMRVSGFLQGDGR